MSMSQMKTKQPLIDLDGVVYRAGFATKDDEPVENALQITKTVIANIEDHVFTERAHPSILFLSGSGNFRDDVATIQPYKGDRKTKPKPKYYDDIRDYLINSRGARVVDGREADDALGEMQWIARKDSTCIVTQDKDLKTIKGYNYNWVSKVGTHISENDADLFLLWQVIQGDRVDSIPGLKGYGPKKASDIIKDGNKDVVQVKRLILNEYRTHHPKDYRGRLHEITTLLFIHREPGLTYDNYIGAW